MGEHEEAALAQALGIFPVWLTRRAALVVGAVQILAGVAGLSYASRWYAQVEGMVEVRGVVAVASAPRPVTRTSLEQTIRIAAPHRDRLYETEITLRVTPQTVVPVGKTWRCTLVPGDPKSLRGGTLSMHRTGPLVALAVAGFFTVLGTAFLFTVVFRPEDPA